mgnify:CR=1 FL=1
MKIIGRDHAIPTIHLKSASTWTITGPYFTEIIYGVRAITWHVHIASQFERLIVVGLNPVNSTRDLMIEYFLGTLHATVEFKEISNSNDAPNKSR